MNSKAKTIKNPLRIGKTLGSFTVDKEGPQMFINLKANEEKAARISKVMGVELSAEDVALFTFLHEMTHYKQWKRGQVTVKDLHDVKFKETVRSKVLEVQADSNAVEFIKKNIGSHKQWTRRTLQAIVGAEKTITLEQARDLGIIS